MPSSPQPLKFSPNGWRIMTQDVKAAETFLVGEPLVIDTNGALTVAAAVGSAIDISSSPNGLLFGFAKNNAAECLELGIPCEVMVPVAGAWVEGSIYHTTAASAVLAQNAFDAIVTLPLLRVAAGLWVFDKEHDGTDDLVLLASKSGNEPWSEQYGTFRATFLEAAAWRGMN